MNTLLLGQTNQYVVRLQQFLNMKGYTQPITGFFGNITRANLMKYQSDNKTEPTGIADGVFVDLITSQDKLDLFCHAIQEREGFFAPGENSQYPNGTPAWYNNNPGNIKWAGQNGATRNGNFAKFKTYQDGYNELKNLLIYAFTGQISFYDPNASILQFFQGLPPKYFGYSPDSDGNDSNSYANQVAGKLGVPVSTPIKNLLV